MEHSPTALSPPPAARLPGLWSALGMVALYFALQLLVSGTLGLIIGVITGLGRPGHSARPLGAQMRSLFAQPDVNALLVISTLLITAAVILHLSRRCWPTSAPALKSRSPAIRSASTSPPRSSASTSTRGRSAR